MDSRTSVLLVVGIFYLSSGLTNAQTDSAPAGSLNSTAVPNNSSNINISETPAPVVRPASGANGGPCNGFLYIGGNPATLCRDKCHGDSEIQIPTFLTMTSFPSLFFPSIRTCAESLICCFDYTRIIHLPSSVRAHPPN